MHWDREPHGTGPGADDGTDPFRGAGAGITRRLLLHGGRGLRAEQLARHALLDPCGVERVLGRLEARGDLRVRTGGRLELVDPVAVMRALARGLAQAPRVVVRGRVLERDGERRARAVSSVLLRAGVRHVAAGRTGAWALGVGEAPPVTAFHVEHWPARPVFDELGFQEDEGPSNLELVLAQDPGCFLDARARRGLRAPAPLQVWLDLFGRGSPELDAWESLEREGSPVET